MLRKINEKDELTRFFTKELMENEVGVIIDVAMPQDSYVAIDIDKYYHANQHPTPAIADILLVAQRISRNEQHHIYIIEMKNISSPRRFKVENIYEKFHTAIDDFMKVKYADIFMDEKHQVEKFRLLFISDAYRLKRKGFSDNQIRSFLLETKMMLFQKMPAFHYRKFKATIDYKLPNPLLNWH